MTAPLPRIIQPDMKQLVAANAAILRRLDRIETILSVMAERQKRLERAVQRAAQRGESPPVLRPHVKAIVDRVATETGIPVSDIMGRKKTAAIIEARFRCYAEANDAGFSYSAIGRAMKRDHTTVMAGAERHRAMRPQGGAQ